MSPADRWNIHWNSVRLALPPRVAQWKIAVEAR